MEYQTKVFPSGENVTSRILYNMEPFVFGHLRNREFMQRHFQENWSVGVEVKGCDNVFAAWYKMKNKSTDSNKIKIYRKARNMLLSSKF